MDENFEKLFEESFKSVEMTPGSIVTGTVVDIDNEDVTVHVGLKSEGVIHKSQFLNSNGEFEVDIGDEIRVAMETVDDGYGATRLSREKAKRAETWDVLEQAYESSEPVVGILSGKIKGGFTVDIEDIKAFLPGSQVDIRPIRDTVHLEGQTLQFQVIKLDPKRNNVVVSRRAVLELEHSEERDALLSSLEEGQTRKGVVKSLTDYGAFVDLGGIDGLLHITDMSWRRIRHPGEVVNVGDEIEIKIIAFDRERLRVSLGLKQLGQDPWDNITQRFPKGTIVPAVVTNITEYGCFAEIEEGIEGLVHVSEMDWTNRNVIPSRFVTVGENMDVMVLDIDETRRRVSLGMKQCRENPWDTFKNTHNVGDKVRGQIKSITDFGIFVGLEGNVDGLVHLSDMSWTEPSETVIRRFSKGEEVEAVVLQIEAERERIALGIKQLEKDAFSAFMEENGRGSVVSGLVTEVDAREARVKLADGVEGVVRASEISHDHIDDARHKLRVGTEIEAKIISVDVRYRYIGLSVKAREKDDEKFAHKEYQKQESERAQAVTLGDLIKSQMDGDKEPQDDSAL